MGRWRALRCASTARACVCVCVYTQAFTEIARLVVAREAREGGPADRTGAGSVRCVSLLGVCGGVLRCRCV